MAAKGVAFAEANQPEFARYARAIVDNARILAEACLADGMTVPTGGTDNHLLLVDVRPFGLTGRQAESAVRRSGITLNRNSLPFDPNGPWYTSGLRLGTPAVTTLGMGAAEMQEIAHVLKLILSNTVADETRGEDNAIGRSKAKFTVKPAAETEARMRLDALLSRFPVYPQLDLPLLQKHFGGEVG
jgi:glycine hydroxymethyltransferase